MGTWPGLTSSFLEESHDQTMKTGIIAQSVRTGSFLHVPHNIPSGLQERESLKLYVCRNEKYLPRMEKLTGSRSLRGSRVTLLLFPFCVGIFCWAELERHSEAQLTAEPDHPNIPWFGSKTNQNGERGLCSGFNASTPLGNHIFQTIRDLVKWSSHQQGACWTLPCSTYSLKKISKPCKHLKLVLFLTSDSQTEITNCISNNIYLRLNHTDRL